MVVSLPSSPSSEINGQLHVMSGAISQVAKVMSTIKHLRFGDEHLG